MQKNGLIEYKNDDNHKNGMSAMLYAYECYKTENPIENMSSVIEYNQFDCRILKEILHYLREKH